MRKRKLKGEFEMRSRVGSLAFFFSIPISFFFACVFLLTTLSLIVAKEVNEVRWGLFGGGCLTMILLVYLVEIKRLQTLVHELKHAVVVLLTGNKLHDMEVNAGTGHVKYAIHRHLSHVEPFIILAPYCFPLLSLPIFIASLILENSYSEICAYFLGLTLAGDYAGVYKELHDGQSDLKRIFGGFFVAGLYIGGINFVWTMTTLLWMQGGREGFLHAADLVLQIVARVIQ